MELGTYAYHQMGEFTIVAASIRLTGEGLAHYKRVIELVYGYL